ncbi:hypothetical protein [Sulfobacillus sp. hq2]|uniref:hypothetical protein n=1 Tax=Sulfobacillus TaxID=28033 RepID=UPI0011AF8D02|nr:hypothetical protein [Sulfobacillus sp. hq2]
MMDFLTLWTSDSEQEWKQALNRYWSFVQPANYALEQDMDHLDRAVVQSLTAADFYDWLYNKYFVWKYTQKNRLATTRRALAKRHQDAAGLKELEEIQHQIFTIDTYAQPSQALDNVTRIGGLGTAGASGLLAVLFPEHFGTVDVFVAENLLQVPAYVNQLPTIKPNGTINITKDQAVWMVKVFRQKADELNAMFRTDFWTPRRIDMVLWGTRS